MAQAEFHIKSILLNLGYLKPKFERNGDRLTVWPGERERVRSLLVKGGGKILNPSKKRKVIGEPLTSTLLDEVEAWALFVAQTQGYACPKIDVEAQSWNDLILVKAQLGQIKKISRVNTDDLDGLSDHVLDRYQPFQIGDIYDIRKTQLMTSRMLTDGLFQSAYFLTDCEEDEIFLDLRTSVGKPKILRIGIGASTEEMPFVDVSFRNARLDAKASSFTASLHASPRLQSFDLGAELYFFPNWHRTFLAPRFRLARESEDAYETNSTRTGADIGHSWDLADFRFAARVGPTRNFVKTIKGIGPDNSAYSTLDASLFMMSHLYESSIRRQYEGWNAGFFFRGQGKGLGSQVNVNRYEMNAKYLWNLKSYSPPIFVLGTRIQGITVDAEKINNQDATSLIPIDERIFVGGENDLRGFTRKSISNQDRGYLTFLYLGFELRLIEELPHHLQPFLLWDLARLGTRRYTLDPTILSSEGFGLRWASPFGTLRSSIARGRVLRQDKANVSYPEELVIFFSFGQEF